MDHSARRSMKNAANCAKHGELQGFMKPLHVEHILWPWLTGQGLAHLRVVNTWNLTSLLKQRCAWYSGLGLCTALSQFIWDSFKLQPNKGRKRDSRNVGQTLLLGGTVWWRNSMQTHFVSFCMAFYRVCFALESLLCTIVALNEKIITLTSDWTGLPAEFKHIIERWKRN